MSISSTFALSWRAKKSLKSLSSLKSGSKYLLRELVFLDSSSFCSKFLHEKLLFEFLAHLATPMATEYCAYSGKTARKGFSSVEFALKVSLNRSCKPL